MFAILNSSAGAVETSAAWSQNDMDNRTFYHARLFRAIIQTDGEKLFKTVEWVVTRDNDPDFVMTVPLCFGIRHRNCIILEDEEIPAGAQPFNVNEEEMIRRDGKFVAAAPDSHPLVAVFADGKLKIL